MLGASQLFAGAFLDTALTALATAGIAAPALSQETAAVAVPAGESSSQ